MLKMNEPDNCSRKLLVAAHAVVKTAERVGSGEKMADELWVAIDKLRRQICREYVTHNKRLARDLSARNDNQSRLAAAKPSGRPRPEWAKPAKVASTSSLFPSSDGEEPE